jgi:aspartate/methionine/tyrosine aminotransferase
VDVERLISARADAVKESVIRRVFEEARDVRDPINLTIGQPDFPVAEPIKQGAIRAIQQDRNGYSSNRGIDPLLAALAARLKWDLGWTVATGKPGPGQASLMVTNGTAGALVLAAQCLLNPGDELIYPDPYFLLYPRLAEMTGARGIPCDTYPDFRLTAERVEPLITPRTKAVILDSPNNPCGTVSSERDCRELLDLCRRRGVLLVSDEIYDEFTYPDARTQAAAGDPSRLLCPSPARFAGAQEDVLLIRGFGKTYGFTGWRMGYASGPPALVERMLRLQQHFYICAATPLQWGALEALGVDMTAVLERFRARRDMVYQRLSGVTELPLPGGAFYGFVKVPDRLGMTASRFKDAAKARRVLVVPGMAFSARDTHFRLSYACDERVLEEGLGILVDLMKN